ncbi:MAG: hypothetical protein JJE36_01365 [Coriobacteriia bacterium]|nr:hypothetical protein [Coriobacteriia bacterium]
MTPMEALSEGIGRVRADVAVEDIGVEDEEHGVVVGFRGSPTVLIDGSDIEPNPQTPLGSMG